MLAATLSPSSWLAARAIEAYQRFVSPYKGFRCAHRAVHGKDSCSQFARRIVARRGIFAMFSLLRRRFAECGAAAQVLDYESRERQRRSALKQEDERRQKSSWTDGCDPGFDACDCATSPLQHVPGAGDCGGVPNLSDGDCAGGGAANCVPTAGCDSAGDCVGAADCGGCDFSI